MTGEQASDSTKLPPHLHGSLPRDTVTVADLRARWPAPVAEQFASLTKDCISVEAAASRPTFQAIVERLSLLGHEPERAEEQVMACECILCMSHSRRTRLRPCCHVVYCEECAEEAGRRRMPLLGPPVGPSLLVPSRLLSPDPFLLYPDHYPSDLVQSLSSGPALLSVPLSSALDSRLSPFLPPSLPSLLRPSFSPS